MAVQIENPSHLQSSRAPRNIVLAGAINDGKPKGLGLTAKPINTSARAIKEGLKGSFALRQAPVVKQPSGEYTGKVVIIRYDSSGELAAFLIQNTPHLDAPPQKYRCDGNLLVKAEPIPTESPIAKALPAEIGQKAWTGQPGQSIRFTLLAVASPNPA